MVAVADTIERRDAVVIRGNRLAINDAQPRSTPVGARQGHLLGPLKPILKCSAQSIQQIQCRPTAPQEPRNRIRANAENPKTSHSSLFERRLNLLIKVYRTPVSGVFRR
jgi:hypothetical protein